MPIPKILLGAPTFEGKEYCIDFWAKNVGQIRKTTPCDVLLIDNSQSSRYSNLLRKKYGIKVIRSKFYKNQPLRTLAEARKKLYDYALKNKFDFLFSLEQDVFPPKDILERLLKIRSKIAKESVIGTPYIISAITQEKSPYLKLDDLTCVALGRIYSRKMHRKIQQNMTYKNIKKRKKVFKAYACGFGCTLIDVSILKKTKVKYTEKQFRPDDAFFYLDCYKKGIPVYIDPTLAGKILHICGSVLGIASWGQRWK
jgi:GT2 family glycosyltransferase